MSRPATEALAPAFWQLDPERRGMLRTAPATVRLILSFAHTAAPARTRLVLALHAVSGLLAAVGLLAVTAVLRDLFADAPTAARLAAAAPALVTACAAMSLRAAVETGAALAQAGLGPAVRRLAEERLLDRSLRVGADAFEDPGFHDWLHRARTRGLAQLEQATANVVAVLGALLALGGAAGALGALHLLLLPVLVISVVPEGWALLRAATLRHAGVARMVAVDRRARTMVDLGTDRAAAAELRACQAEPFLLDRYRVAADALREESTRVEARAATTNGLGRAVGGLALGLTLVLLVLLVHAGWIPLAAGGAALVAVRSARGALGQVVRSGNQLLEQGLYVGDFHRFLTEAHTRRRVGGPVPVPPAPGEITLTDVGFRYPGTAGPPALSGITLALRRGESIALVGVNGSGKTTLARVIAGLYPPTEGTVAWDGVDVRDLDPAQVADRVAMVQQHPVRWPEDARTNIRVGRAERPDPGDAALLAAAAAARADEVVTRLPEGWDTLLTKEFHRGRDLSGGQWQRIAVARGLYRDAPVLIWDEPTTALDPTAEAAVHDTLRAASAGRTAIMITHRLASVRHVDRVVVLDGGRIVEVGSHAELLASGGTYAGLWAARARLLAEPVPS